LFIALQVLVRGEDGGSGDGVADVGEVEEAPASENSTDVFTSMIPLTSHI
jgi:hypothetical protein